LGMEVDLRLCRPIEVPYKVFPSRRVLVSTVRRIAGIKKPRYSYRVDKEGRVYIYITDLASKRRRVAKLLVRPVEHVHGDTGLIDSYWSLVYAYLCEEVKG